MNYENRKRLISNWLFEFLKRYEAPPHLDKDAARQEMVLMVEDINSEIPKCEESSMKYLLDKVSSFVRKNAKSRRWPTISMFVSGVKEYRKEVIVTEADAIPSLPKDHDHSTYYANKIKRREEVPDHWIIGISGQRLLELNLVTEQDLEPYKKYLDHQKQNVKVNSR